MREKQSLCGDFNTVYEIRTIETNGMEHRKSMTGRKREWGNYNWENGTESRN